MRIHRLPIAALTSAGLLLAGAAPAADPPFQTPNAPKPDAPRPPSPPAFDVAPSDAPTSPGQGAQPAPPAPSPSPPPQPSSRAAGDAPADLPSPSPPPASPAPAPPPRIMPIEGGDAAPSPPARTPPARKTPQAISAASAPPTATAPSAAPTKKSATLKPRSRAGKRVARATAGGPAATYPGFRLLEGGGSRVFVKIAGKVSVAERKGQGQHVIALSGVSVPSRNDRRPLDTSFFPTPVSQVRLVPHEGGADLVIELKQPSAMELRVEELRDGIVVMIDFPRLAGGPRGALP